jgi:hypothetical protein
MKKFCAHCGNKTAMMSYEQYASYAGKTLKEFGEALINISHFDDDHIKENYPKEYSKLTRIFNDIKESVNSLDYNDVVELKVIARKTKT